MYTDLKGNCGRDGGREKGREERRKERREGGKERSKSCIEIPQLGMLLFFFFFGFCLFRGPLLGHMEVARLGVQVEL